MTYPPDLLDQAQSTVVDLAIKFGPRLVVATLILIAGAYAGRWVGRLFERWLQHITIEAPLRQLLVRTLRLLVMILFMIMALQNLGVDLIPLIAGLGVAGAGVALAMQGVLANLVAGLTIIFTRPFRVGEYIAIVGVEGQVRSIDLFSTRLGHADQSVVVVPNRRIVGEILHNYGQIRQLDLRVRLRGSEDVEPALAAIRAELAANPRVLAEPAAIVAVAALGESTLDVAIKPWVGVADVGPASGEINQAVAGRLFAAGISCPPLAGSFRLLGGATS